MRAQNEYHLEQACTKCTYKRHIAIKQEVDVHEDGDNAIENKMWSTGLHVQVRHGPRIMRFFIH